MSLKKGKYHIKAAHGAIIDAESDSDKRFDKASSFERFWLKNQRLMKSKI